VPTKDKTGLILCPLTRPHVREVASYFKLAFLGVQVSHLPARSAEANIHSHQQAAKTASREVRQLASSRQRRDSERSTNLE